MKELLKNKADIETKISELLFDFIKDNNLQYVRPEIDINVSQMLTGSKIEDVRVQIELTI